MKVKIITAFLEIKKKKHAGRLGRGGCSYRGIERDTNPTLNVLNLSLSKCSSMKQSMPFITSENTALAQCQGGD